MRRAAKRRTKKGFVLILSAIFLIFLIFLGIKLIPLARNLFPQNQNKNQAIIKPFVYNLNIDDLRAKLEDKQIGIDSLEVSSQSGILTLKIHDGPVVLFSDTDDVDQQISSLQLIIRRLTIDKGTSGNIRKPTQIDLRFNNPVVQF